MARPRNGGAASSTTHTTNTNTNANAGPGIASPGSPATRSAQQSTVSTPIATGRSSRRGTVAASAVPAYLATAPSTPSPLAEVAGEASTPPSTTSKTPGGRVEPKAHALRSVGGAAQLVTSPFPGEYGGSERCGVHEEDEADEVLMAICGACALSDNRALSAEEVARTAFYYGWLRPPTAAVEPTSHINLSIRNHHKRCEKASPPRAPLLGKYQLTGAAAEQSLQPALHPDAFNGSVRPKGTVFYLTTAGKQKWKNPFDGLELIKPAPKKVQPKKIAPAPVRVNSAAGSGTGTQAKGKGGKDKKKGKGRSGTPAKSSPVLQQQQEQQPPEEEQVEEVKTKVEDASTPAPTLKIKLRTSSGSSEKEASGIVEAVEDVKPDVHALNTALESRSPSPPRESVVVERKPKARRPSNLYDSSDESETSSEEDTPGPSCSNSRLRPVPIRKAPPPPINTTGSPRLSGSPRFSALMRLPSQGSPFRDLFFSPTTCASSAFSSLATAQQPPAPAHSLDNEYWASRTYDYETSSSSSDDEAREDWGQASEILIRGGDAELNDDKRWSVPDEEDAKIKQATDALRALFPANTQEDDEMNGLDESVGTLLSEGSPARDEVMTAVAFRACTSPSVALTTAPASSSPLASPYIAPACSLPQPPTPISPAHSPFEAQGDAMDLDGMWLDELPVVADAEDAFSDGEDVLSATGDEPAHDFRLDDTAEWARETAVSAPFSDKDLGPADYPSPILTDAGSDGSDLTSIGPTDVSRSPSADALSPLSQTSDIEPGDLSQEYDYNPEEYYCGPESMTQEELDEDEWMQARIRGKTPKKAAQKLKAKSGIGMGMTPCSKLWGIGVGELAGPQVVKTPVRALRSNHALTPTPPEVASVQVESVHVEATGAVDVDVDMDIDNDAVETEQEAIGTADLEMARLEAEEQEAKRREVREKQAARNRALFEAYRQHLDLSCPSTPFTPFDGHARPRTSNDFFSPSSASTVASASASASGDATPTPTALPTPTTSYGGMSPLALHSLSTLSLTELNNAVSAGASVGRGGEELKCNGDGVPCIPGMAALEMVPMPMAIPIVRPCPPPLPAQASPSAPASVLAHSPVPQMDGAFGYEAIKQEVMPVPASAPAPPATIKTEQVAASASAPPLQSQQPQQPTLPTQPAQIPPAFVNGPNIARHLPPLAPHPSAPPSGTTVAIPNAAPGGTVAAGAAGKKGGKKAAGKCAPATAVAKTSAAASKQAAPLAATNGTPVTVAATAGSGGATGPATTPVSTPMLAHTPTQDSNAVQLQASGSITIDKAPAPGPASLPAPPLASVPPTSSSAPPTAKPAPKAAPASGPVTAKANSSCVIKPGITATVLANVPVFVHAAKVNNRRIEVCRRLDTDWTNMTKFLMAAGMSDDAIAAALAPGVIKQREVVKKSRPDTPLVDRNPECIIGTWVPIQAARKLATLHGIDPQSQLAMLLDDSLFGIFRKISKFNGDRGLSGSFGQNFIPNAQFCTVPNTPVRPPVNNTLSAAITGPMAKAPLTRPANGVPEGCPQPKRRRATLVGQTSVPAAIRPSAAGTAAAGSVRPVRPGVNIPVSASAPTSPKGSVPLHPRLANPVAGGASIGHASSTGPKPAAPQFAPQARPAPPVSMGAGRAPPAPTPINGAMSQARGANAVAPLVRPVVAPTPASGAAVRPPTQHTRAHPTGPVAAPPLKPPSPPAPSTSTNSGMSMRAPPTASAPLVSLAGNLETNATVSVAPRRHTRSQPTETPITAAS